MWRRSTNLLIYLMFGVTLTLKSWPTFAQIRVIEIRPTFPMADGLTAPTDYIINAGSNQGLKLGQILKVKRDVPILSQLQRDQGATLPLPIGEIEVIWVDTQFSIARLKKVSHHDNFPLLEIPSVTLGDRIEP